MRLVHFTDIHLSKANFDEFEDYFKDALINDLKVYHESEKIELFIITGDLVDKGGHSLFEIDKFKDKTKYISPYIIFEEVFIDPISKELNIDKSKFIFIPGNHDIDENSINYGSELNLTNTIDSTTINKYLNQNKISCDDRISCFKMFEETYHHQNCTPNYQFSNNQSTFILDTECGNKVGFLLLNDSWRCKSRKFEKESQDLYFGVKQIHEGLIELNSTQLNICLFHHTLDQLEERNDIIKALCSKSIGFILNGHTHDGKYNEVNTSFGTYLIINGRATLNKPDEVHSNYQPGYTILDIDLEIMRILRIHYKRYNKDSPGFIYDNLHCPPDGINKGRYSNGIEIKGNQQFAKSNATSKNTNLSDLNIAYFKSEIK